MHINQRKALIIGGMPKAGTTSVFNWLAAHPDFAPSKIKETRFFLDTHYPLPSGSRYDGTNLPEYLKFFPPAGDNRILLESSPDYMYCRTPIQLAHVMPNSRIVFIVRDPVERVISWYKFGAQLGYFDKTLSFADFVEAQAGQPVSETTPIYMRALDQNRINKYLPAFRDAFGERCLVLDFITIKNDPRAAARRICDFAGVDPAFFDTFTFEAKNVSTGIHASRKARLYYRTRAWIIYTFKPTPAVKRYIRPFAGMLKRTISGKTALERINLTEDLVARIREDASLVT